jgi:hypothetical protein
MNELKEREITWFGKILAEALKELEEFGDFHENNCGLFVDENYPDDCDCDMRGLKPFLKEKMEALNQYWIRNIDEHRPHCSPEGNKILTRIKGAKNRPRPH